MLLTLLRRLPSLKKETGIVNSTSHPSGSGPSRSTPLLHHRCRVPTRKMKENSCLPSYLHRLPSLTLSVTEIVCLTVKFYRRDYETWASASSGPKKKTNPQLLLVLLASLSPFPLVPVAVLLCSPSPSTSVAGFRSLVLCSPVVQVEIEKNKVQQPTPPLCKSRLLWFPLKKMMLSPRTATRFQTPSTPAKEDEEQSSVPLLVLTLKEMMDAEDAPMLSRSPLLGSREEDVQSSSPLNACHRLLSSLLPVHVLLPL